MEHDFLSMYATTIRTLRVTTTIASTTRGTTKGITTTTK